VVRVQAVPLQARVSVLGLGLVLVQLQALRLVLAQERVLELLLRLVLRPDLSGEASRRIGRWAHQRRPSTPRQ
jgi:hypothetical protein